uniref:Uncharacterized protein n=1 Tax=Strongyloides papillosus TaxID=174720 RepID=A0A0N5CDQ3_STREA
MTIEESRKILDLRYKGATQQPEAVINDGTNGTTTIGTDLNEDNITVPQEEYHEEINEENTKEQISISEALSPISETVEDDKEMNNGKLNDEEKRNTKKSDKDEPPTIFEELFIDTLTKSLDKRKKKFFNSNFGDIPVEESFETLGRLCYRFLQHYHFFCVQQPITTQNEMRCRGYQQDCSQFFRPKSPLEAVSEKLQSNIRLGYYKLHDMQKTMSPFI